MSGLVSDECTDHIVHAGCSRIEAPAQIVARQLITTRREFLTTPALATASIPFGALTSDSVTPAQARALSSRAIPSSGERITAIGMGTSGSFDVDSAGRQPQREVLRHFVAGGATLIDTSPNYGNAEDVLGDLMAELQIRDKISLTTKLAADDRAAGEAQFARSLSRLRSDRIDRLCIHNLRDWKVQLALARELKKQGKVR